MENALGKPMTDTRGHRCTCEQSHEFWRPYPIPRACPVMTPWGGPCGARITIGDFYAILKVQNGRIRQAMEDVGVSTASELARRAGQGATAVGRLLNFKISPRRPTDGQWRRVTIDVCDALMVDPADIFPDHLTVTMDSNQIAGYVERGQIPHADHRKLPSPVEAAVAGELKEKIGKALETLTFREAEIIKLLYGVGDGREYTLEECATIFSITRERVRQIFAKGLRKLQHPERSAILGDFVVEDR
jgi:RNA polymerase sigma factor (sigma-70 family)